MLPDSKATAELDFCCACPHVALTKSRLHEYDNYGLCRHITNREAYWGVPKERRIMPDVTEVLQALVRLPGFSVLVDADTAYSVPGITWHIQIGKSGSGKSSSHALLSRLVEDASAVVNLYCARTAGPQGGQQQPLHQLLRLGVRESE